MNDWGVGEVDELLGVVERKRMVGLIRSDRG